VKTVLHKVLLKIKVLSFDNFDRLFDKKRYPFKISRFPLYNSESVCQLSNSKQLENAARKNYNFIYNPRKQDQSKRIMPSKF
jgi:hypothetical protein